MRVDRSSDDLLSLGEENYIRLDDRRGLFWQLDSAGRWFSWWLDKKFQLSDRQTTASREVWCGCISFMSMSYVVLVVPALLHKTEPGLSLEALVAATNLSAAFGSFLAGVLGNAPVGITPSLRLNAYFSFGFCRTYNISWAEGLTCCFVSGVVFLLLALFGVCNWIAKTVLTDHLKKAIAVAMGIFQAIIGFKMMGLITPDAEDYVQLAKLRSSNKFQVFLMTVLILISSVLIAARLNGALMISIVMVAVGSWYFGMWAPPDDFCSLPPFTTILAMDFSCWYDQDKIGNLLLGTAVMLLVSVFDVVGVQYGLYSIAGLVKHGTVPGSWGLNVSAGLGTIMGSLLGVGPLVIANESSAGILEGARTGLSAVVVSILFFMSSFITPLLKAVPDLAAAVPLILIGSFMTEPSRTIAWDNMRVALPCFFAIVLIPHAIHNGIIVSVVVDILLGLVVRCGETWSELDNTPTASSVMPLVTISRVNAGAGGGGAGSQPAEGARASSEPPRQNERSMLYAQKKNRLATPHSWIPNHIGLKDSEKVERVRELLHELGPADNLLSASETWEQALRRALEQYLEGMRQPAAVAVQPPSRRKNPARHGARPPERHVSYVESGRPLDARARGSH